MANICLNWVNVVGESAKLQEVKRLIEPEVLSMDVNYEDEGQMTLSLETKWSPPEEELKQISTDLGVLIECEYEECGNDIWGKFAYNGGDLVFDISMPYLEGKYNSMEWNDFVECEVLHRVHDAEDLEEFLENFENIVSGDEINELIQIYYEER
jgi:hypothetical protein